MKQVAERISEEERKARRLARAAAYRAANREKRATSVATYEAANREKRAAYRAANKEKAAAAARRRKLRRVFNMTPEDHAAIFEAQGRVCACCGVTEPGSKSGWSTDHCHETGKVRGILCHHCNTGLGRLRDSPRNAAACIRYLAAHGKAITTAELLAIVGPLSPPTHTP